MFEDRLTPVLEVARSHAAAVDAGGRFPEETVLALRGSGLMGLTLPTEVKGLGGGPLEFVEVVSALAGACGSTAMVYLMHVSAAMCVAAAPPVGLPHLLTDLATGDALATLAFSEKGSRSHFWAPVSTAAIEDGEVAIRADKSFVTSAGHADVYVVSTRSSAGGPMDLDMYAVPSGTKGLDVATPWQGMGLRGNASSPMVLDVTVPSATRLGAPCAGFGLMMEVVLPWFNLGNAAVSLGFAAAATESAVAHATGARFEHTGDALADLPTIRARLARMHIAVEAQRAYLRMAAAKVAEPAEDTLLHVLGVKASVNDAALSITDEAMRVCGGTAFSKALPVERCFRDARAGSVMAPTADVLHEFYGKALTGRPLFS